MKSSRVYIKANYIKKAKIDWIYCDAQIIKQNNISMLKLSSVNATSDDKEDTQSRVSNFSNVSTIYRSKLPQSVGLKVLCNLSGFKSSEIKPVNFYNTEKFAIKLVPGGLLNSKKLFLIPEHEEDLTKWCTVLGDQVSRGDRGPELREANSEAVQRQARRDSCSTLRSKKELVREEPIDIEVIEATLERRIERSVPTHYNDDKSSVTPNSPVSCDSDKSDEVYFAMDDNDVYEISSAADNIYTVRVEESSDSSKIGLEGSFLIKLKPEGIELCDLKKGVMVHEFPYIFIRRFGAKKDLLRLEAGRKCTTGQGYFVFRFKDAAKAVENIKELVKELKKSCSKSPETDQEDSCPSNRNSVSMSVNSATFDCNVDTTLTRPVQSTISSGNFSSPSNFSASGNFSSPGNFSSSGHFSPPPVAAKPVRSQTANIVTAAPSYPTSSIKKPLHPLYNSVNSIPNGCCSPVKSVVVNPQSQHGSRSSSVSRLPVTNNTFNRNQYASSFSYRRPAQVNIPITKDDSATRSAIYDNIPAYEQKPNQFNYQPSASARTMQSPSSNMKFTSSYTMQNPLANTSNGQYDNVPNNQRCIRELESMLMDLGIATN